MKHFATILTTLTILLTLSTSILAEEHKKETPSKETDVDLKMVTDTAEKLTTWMEEMASKFEEPKTMDKTIKLEFTFEDKKSGDKHTAFLLTATENYHLNAHFEFEMTYSVNIEGRVRMIGENQVLLEFHSHLGFSSDDGDAEVEGSGSAKIKTGTSRQLAKLFDTTLTVKVSVED